MHQPNNIGEFDTPRLRVQPLDLGTCRKKQLEQDLQRMLTPSVLAHLPAPLQAASPIGEWIDARASESEVLLVHQKKGGALIGLVLLAHFGREVHLGYLLGEAAWGQGYATELIQGLLPHLQQAGARRIIGGVGKDNPASARVLEKAGFWESANPSSIETLQYLWTAPRR